MKYNNAYSMLTEHTLPETGKTVTTFELAIGHKHQEVANIDVAGGRCTIRKSSSLRNVDHVEARTGDTQRNST